METLRSILGSHPAVSLVTLFGSFARGDAGPNSDIDVFVWLAANEPFDRNDIWEYWDRQTRQIPWTTKVSIVIRRFKPEIHIDTLLLDLPEEHVLVFDRKNNFVRLRDAVVRWRKKNRSLKMASFGGKHTWKYSTRVRRLDEIDFRLEIEDVT